MANVLTSFLIGIGFDTSKLDSGMRDVDTRMGQVKGSALKVSAALVGAFGAAAASVVKTASDVDQLALKTGNMRTSMQYIYNYGNALKFLGGNAEDALSIVSGIEKTLNNLQLKGELGPLQDLALAGIDISQLTNAKSAEEFLATLSQQVPGLDKNQRGVVQQSLGLSDAALKSLTQGPEAFQSSLVKSEELTGNLNELTDNSRKLMENAAEFSLTIDGITNELAKKFLPSLVGVSGWINNFLKENKGSISEAIQYAADNSAATATLGTGALAATIGAGLSKIGLSTIGGAVGGAGTLGVAVAGSAIGANVLNESLGKYVPGYSKASTGFDEILKSVTGLDRIQSPMELIFGGKPNSSAGLSPSDIQQGSSSGMSAAEERQAGADALASALSKSPVKVSNTVNVMLDGQAFENKVIEVNERTAHDTLDDIQSTTAR